MNSTLKTICQACKKYIKVDPGQINIEKSKYAAKKLKMFSL